MHRRIVRGIALLGAAVAVSGATAAAVSYTDNGSSATVAGPSRPALQYWTDAHAALSPLLLYVRILPTSIQAVARAGGRATAGQVHQATVMAESFATARDLVGRLAVPPAVSTGVGEVLQVACQLYRESALALSELRSPQANTMEIVRRADALHQIGDRLIDQTRRLLAIDKGAAQAHIEYRYAPPVPALAAVTGAAAEPAPPTASLEELLTTARGLLTERLATDAASRSGAQSLTAVAGGLENAAGTPGEDVVGARLAVLLGVIAEGAEAAGHPRSVAALHLLANDVWNTARTLSAQPNPAISAVTAATLSRSQVWTGGAFNGRPPAIKPGEGVGSGLPGGLPSVDPTQILRG